jgi:hypothetical protein
LYTERIETGFHSPGREDGSNDSFFPLEFSTSSETIEAESQRSDAMTNRLGIWASVGFLVAVGWALYAFAARPMTFADPMMVLVQLTCPIAIVRSYPIRLEWVLLANAVTYALIGLLVETFQRRIRHAR